MDVEDFFSGGTDSPEQPPSPSGSGTVDETDVEILALELENVLTTVCSPLTIQNVLKGRPAPDHLRKDVWTAALQLHKYNSSGSTVTLCEIFDLPEQSRIRVDCQEVVNKILPETLSSEERLPIQSDLESVVTTYCKEAGLSYQTDSHILSVLTPLLAVGFRKTELYSALKVLMDNFVPRDNGKNGRIYHVFRLLLLYHEPELCSFLDTRQIFPDAYCMPWFRSLFAASCSVTVIRRIWDIYFAQTDPFFLTFLALVIMVNAKDQILTMKAKDRSDIIQLLQSIPDQLSEEDVQDFCSIANFFSAKTPQSYWREFYFLFDPDVPLVGSVSTRSQSPTTSSSSVIAAAGTNPYQALCMPVSVSELLSVPFEQTQIGLRYFLVDCRPPEQYNAGHLPTAFHLNAKLMVSEPDCFETALKGLLLAQSHAMDAGSQAGGEHLCFLGSGREEEDQFVNMVISAFLKRSHSLVSCVVGGFNAVHEALQDELPMALTDHDARLCIPCQKEQQNGATQPNHNRSTTSSSWRKNVSSTSTSFFEKLSVSMKQKSSEVKEKLIEIITNPHIQELEQQISQGIVPSAVKDGLIKRSSRVVHPATSVFRIGPDESSEEEINEGDASTHAHRRHSSREEEAVPLDSWLKRSDVLGHFECQEVKPDGKAYDSILLVCKSQLFVLRKIETPKKSERGSILVTESVRRSHGSIVRITSKRKHPELLTIKYGVPRDMEEDFIITDIDRLMIPKAFEATRLIKQEVLRIAEESQKEQGAAYIAGEDDEELQAT